MDMNCLKSTTGISPVISSERTLKYLPARSRSAMSIQDRGEGVETAAGRIDAAAGTVEENALVFEASEDRILVGAVAAPGGNDVTCELSFSSQMLTDAAPSSDETASGVVCLVNSAGSAYWPFFGETGAKWHAGEELNLHVDNASGSQELVIVLIAYIPVGEFNRSTLRNR